MGERAAATGHGHLTILGDLIDRGPDHLGALKLAVQPVDAWGFSGKTLLIGNHDLFLALLLGEGHSHVRHFKLQARDFFCLLMSKQAVRFDCDWVRLEAQSQNDGRSSSDTRIGTAGPDASWSCLGLGTSVGKSRLIVAARVLRP
ncbi:hypothetical protein ACMS1Z_13460 [Acidiphilium multivorum]|uniref:hypothetical protein n=1 Tax=Acidiphilium multivorum TaxID=62140 RepID=UPI0039C9C5E8